MADEGLEFEWDEAKAEATLKSTAFYSSQLSRHFAMQDLNWWTTAKTTVRFAGFL